MDIRTVYIYDFTESDGVGSHVKKKMSTAEKEICEELLEEVNSEMANNDRREIVKGSSIFYCLKVDGRIFMCIAGENAKKRIVFGLLEACSEDADFDVHDESQTIIMIKRHIEYHTNSDNDEILKCETKIEDIKEIMVENVDRILRNMEKVGNLVEKTKELKDSGKKFRKAARYTERTQLSKNVIIGTIVICLCYCICCVILTVIIGVMTFIGITVGVLVEVFDREDEEEDVEEEGRRLIISTVLSFFGL